MTVLFVDRNIDWHGRMSRALGHLAAVDSFTAVSTARSNAKRKSYTAVICGDAPGSMELAAELHVEENIVFTFSDTEQVKGVQTFFKSDFHAGQAMITRLRELHGLAK